MSEARPVEITIGGHKLRVSSELPEEYTREVAAYFDAALARIRGEIPTVDAHRAAILAGLAITDELFQARAANSTTAHRLESVMERLARLLPPAKRGSPARDPRSHLPHRWNRADSGLAPEHLLPATATPPASVRYASRKCPTSQIRVRVA